MGKFILDKRRDKRVEIDLGGHWENLMTYLRDGYPNFWQLPDDKKDDFILENFVFGEEDWSEKRSNEYLDYSYVRNFSTGSKGYRLSEEIRSEKDTAEIASYWSALHEKIMSFSSWLVSELSRLEVAMRDCSRHSLSIKDDELGYLGISGSFELIGGAFCATFTHYSGRECLAVSQYIRDSVNSAMVQKGDLSTFFHWFMPAISNEVGFGDEFRTTFSKWIDFEIEMQSELEGGA